MKLKFIIKTVLILISFSIVNVIIIQYLNRFYNDKNDENALYIWGDSQTYQGVDIELLKKKLGIKVYSSAKHGAGVYDFLVFTRNIPPNSNVLIGLSQFILLRAKASDYNRTGIEFNSLTNLLRCNYSIQEVFKILSQNLKIYKDLFLDKTYLNDSCNVKEISKNLEFYDLFYDTLPKYYFSKMKLFKIGMQKLKVSEYILLLFLIWFVKQKKFTYKKVLNDIQSIGDEFAVSSLYVNQINCDSCFYDLSHLNKLGADLLSSKILKMFKDWIKFKNL